MDLRPVEPSSRASFPHPWFSTSWELPHFLNKIVSNCPFKSVCAMPGLLRHGSRWTFNLMERLFSALGTLEDQGSSASCSHLPLQRGKDDNSQLTVSTALWRGGLENLVVWTVPLPVHPCCFSGSSDGCEGGQDSGCSSQQKSGCCFSFCSHPKVAQYLKPSSSFLAATKGLSATFKDYDIESVGAQLSPFLFFILFVFFFPLPSHLRVTSERFLPLNLSACP